MSSLIQIILRLFQGWFTDNANSRTTGSKLDNNITQNNTPSIDIIDKIDIIDWKLRQKFEVDFVDSVKQLICEIKSDNCNNSDSCDNRNNENWGIIGSDIDTDISPMDLAVRICTKFKNYESVLIQAFVKDLHMFEYLYEFLPKDIVVSVLKSIPFDEAVEIVKKNHCSAYIYDQLNPIFYVVRYFNTDHSNVFACDSYCVEFDRTIVPKTNKLEFVLQCKRYVNKTDFIELIDNVLAK